ncbi:uncharacterized protein LOC111620804 [Centruroides sculpturatus]|uniref:uncharacterized protein LOC111620804 n=1 Tax=Centruroides sculpturatus TaxID=218467 RepID=UPI000C6D88B3|nr:uncharacterized protein LOC111620804 [Centruroides sculpturatus]
MKILFILLIQGFLISLAFAGETKDGIKLFTQPKFCSLSHEMTRLTWKCLDVLLTEKQKERLAKFIKCVEEPSIVEFIKSVCAINKGEYEAFVPIFDKCSRRYLTVNDPFKSFTRHDVGGCIREARESLGPDVNGRSGLMVLIQLLLEMFVSNAI